MKQALKNIIRDYPPVEISEIDLEMLKEKDTSEESEAIYKMTEGPKSQRQATEKPAFLQQLIGENDDY